MRRTFDLVSLAVSLVFLATSSGALAQKKGAKKDGPSAAETWTDPVDSEKSDKGPYAPQSEQDEDAPAEPRPVKGKADPGREREQLVVFGQIVIGFGEAPLNNPEYRPSGKGTVVGFQLGGRYDITPALSAGLRVPLTTASVRQANTRNLSTTAFGSPELRGEYRVSLDKLTSIPIAFGIGIPLAEGNPDATATASDTPGIHKDTVNRLADATSGWRDSELFQPKRLPLVLGAGIRHERRDWELHADAKFVFLPALSTDVAVPAEQSGQGTYVINGFALREVTTVGGTYNFLDSPVFWGGLDFSLIWTPIDTFDFEAVSPAPPSRVQAVFEPRVGVRFSRFAPSIGYLAPVGGRLGSGGVGGVRLHLNVDL